MNSADDYPPELLTLSNPKTRKGESYGYLTGILHLTPGKTDAVNVCPHSTLGCRASCLNTAGHGGIGGDSDRLNPVQAARIRRTRYWQRDQAGFMAVLVFEVAALARRAAALGLKPAVRLNGTSDIRWELVSYQGHRNVMQMFPQVQFYDYTKWSLARRHPERCGGNYHLTFSLSESNAEEAELALCSGHNVAVVFAVNSPGRPLPRRHRIGSVTADVIDGDINDLRFLDPVCRSGIGDVVGLRAKGRARTDRTGFARAPDYDL